MDPTAVSTSDHRTSSTKELLYLVRFILRRECLRIPVWIIAIFSFVVLTAASLPSVYQDTADRQIRAELMKNPATKALVGPGHGLDNYTFGAMMTQEMLIFTVLIVAIMSVLIIIRHTRADEAEGRSELIITYQANKWSLLAAAATVVAGVNILLGFLIAIGLGSLNIDGITWGGSWLTGAAVASTGLAFTGIGVLAAQLAQYPRGSLGLAGLIIGVAYVLRAIGDVSGNALSWLSPFGWAQSTMAYVNNQWWPLILPLFTGLFTFTAALIIAKRRDFGSSIFKPKPGRETASRWLNSPLALAMRQQKGSIIAWAISMSMFSALYGSLSNELEGFVAELEPLGLVDPNSENMLVSLLSAVIGIFAIMIMIFTITSISRLKSEELSGHAETILATPVSIVYWICSYAIIACTGSIIILLASALSMSLSASLMIGDINIVPELLKATLVYTPILLLTVGLSTLFFGLATRALNFIWVLFAYSAVIAVFGVFLKFPKWTLWLSPLEHIPKIPSEGFQFAPLIILILLSGATFLTGLFFARRRDLSTT